MSSIHSDKGWLCIAFRLGRRQVRLYPGLRDVRANRRSASVKEARELILRRQWVELARRFPECKHLDQFRPVFTPDATTFRAAAMRFLAFQANTNKPATVEFYRRIIETHITGNLGLALLHRTGSAAPHAGDSRLGDARLVASNHISCETRPVLRDENCDASQRAMWSGDDPASGRANNFTGGSNAESKGSSRLKKSHGDSLRLGGEVESTRTPAGDTNLAGGASSESLSSGRLFRTHGGGAPSAFADKPMGLRPAELFGLKRKDIELAGEGPSRASVRVPLPSCLQGGPSSAFADKPIRLIGASDIAALYAPVAQRGHQAQARNIRRVVSAVFAWARGERGTDGEYLVTDNPVTRTRAVKRDDVHEVNPFASDEIVRVCAAAPEGWQRRLIIVAFETGLRPAELFGLKRKDIDLCGGGALEQTQIRRQGAPPTLHVRQTYSRFGEGSTKTRRSRRTVPLSDAAVRALREQLADVKVGSAWLWPADSQGLKPHNPQNFSRRAWSAILKRAGVEHREFYQCRHTYATRLLTQGVPMQEIAQRMGHTSLRMLFDHYLKWKQPEKPERRKVRR